MKNLSFNPGNELSSLDFNNLIGGPLNAIVEAQNDAALSTVNFIKEVGFDDDDKPVYVSFKYPKEVAAYQPGNVNQLLSVTIQSGGSNYTQGETLLIEGDNLPTGVQYRPAKGSANVGGTSGMLLSVDITDPGEFPIGHATFSLVSSAGGSGASISGALGTVPSSPAVFQEMKIEVPILTMLPVPFLRVDEAKINFNAKINSVERKELSSNFNVAGSLAVEFKKVQFKASASYQRKSFQGIDINKTYSMNVDLRVVQDEVPEGMSRLLGILEQSIVSQPNFSE